MFRAAAAFSLVALVVSPVASSGAEEPKLQPPEQTDVYVAGADGVHTYRIPAMIVSPNGTLLVFCEARKERITDGGPTDMALKRSTDGGKT